MTHTDLRSPDTPPPTVPPRATPGDGGPAAALAQFAEVARAAPRVWAWWPATGGPLRVSGRPPPDGRRADTVAVLVELLQQHRGAAGVDPAVLAALRRAQRADGSLAAPVLLRALSPPTH